MWFCKCVHLPQNSSLGSSCVLSFAKKNAKVDMELDSETWSWEVCVYLYSTEINLSSGNEPSVFFPFGKTIRWSYLQPSGWCEPIHTAQLFWPYICNSLHHWTAGIWSVRMHLQHGSWKWMKHGLSAPRWGHHKRGLQSKWSPVGQRQSLISHLEFYFHMEQQNKAFPETAD